MENIVADLWSSRQ